MRISDWSSDVCSSDLAEGGDRELAGGPAGGAGGRQQPGGPGCGVTHHPLRPRDLGRAGRLHGGCAEEVLPPPPGPGSAAALRLFQIGRASCRERVCQSVKFSWVAVALKKKHETII